MNDFCDLLGTPYAPVSKIAPVKSKSCQKPVPREINIQNKINNNNKNQIIPLVL